MKRNNSASTSSTRESLCSGAHVPKSTLRSGARLSHVANALSELLNSSAKIARAGNIPQPVVPAQAGIQRKMCRGATLSFLCSAASQRIIRAGSPPARGRQAGGLCYPMQHYAERLGNYSECLQ